MEVKKNFSRAPFLRFLRPVDCISAGGVATAVREHLEALLFPLGVDGDDGGLRAEASCDRRDQAWIRDRGGVDADFVGAGIEDCGRIFQRANAAAHGEGHEEFAGGAADSFDQSVARF